MSQSDLFCCFLPLHPPNWLPALSWCSSASSLALIFSSSSLHLDFKDGILHWISWAALFFELDGCSPDIFSYRSNCASLQLWCWVTPSRQIWIVSLCLIAWTNWDKTRLILRHLLPWLRSLVLSCHKCWYPQIVGGCGILYLRPLLPYCSK